MELHRFGWSGSFEQAFAPYASRGFVPARVAREDRDRYLLFTAAGERPGELAGRLRHEASSRADLPAVGDWVAGHDESGLVVIHGVLPRASAFVRKAAGQATEEQVVAANVDTVFVVAGLDGDFNLRRIERYLAAAWESNAVPVVVLNKADLAENLGSRLAEVAAVAPGVEVIAVSAIVGDGLAALKAWLAPGRTVALLGSSGVGKSTLVNALLGEELLATQAVREDDSRGRHTTTHRELVPLPAGALLLDTPGMRELALWAGEESLDGAFLDIGALAAGCRFRDCGHDSEPGCAVLAAVADGAMDAWRLESWRKLRRELRSLATRQDARLRAEEEAKWKAIHRSMKHHPKADRWR